MKKLVIIFGLLMVVGLASAPARAAQFETSQGPGGVTANKGARNLYLAGNSVNSDTNILGDLYAAGANIDLNGLVEQSLFAAGSNINVKASVGQNAKVAGGNINYAAPVGEDLMIAGGIVSVSSATQVNGDLSIGGSQVTENGNIDGKAWITGSDVTLNGKIGGDVIIRAKNNLTIGHDAVIGGDLTYYAPSTATIDSGATIKGLTHYNHFEQQTLRMPSAWTMAGYAGLASFFVLLIPFLTLLVLVYVFPKSIKDFTEKSLGSFWPNLGWGLVALIVAPVVAVILMVTVLGLGLGVILGTAYGVALILAKVLATIIAGALVVKWLGQGKRRIDWLTALVGVLVMFVLGLIPLVGWIIVFGFFMVGLGQLLRYTFDFLKLQR